MTLANGHDNQHCDDNTASYPHERRDKHPPEKQAHRAIGIGLAAFEVLLHLIGEVAATALGFGDWFIGGRSPRTSRASVGTAKKQGAVVLSVRSVASDASQWQ
jgi:hypothetical protein